jgi:hypothetical protein
VDEDGVAGLGDAEDAETGDVVLGLLVDVDLLED